MTAIAEVPVDDRADAPRRRVARWEVATVLLAMATVLVIGLIAIARDAPLLWDEAVYGLRVRDLVGEEVRGRYWIDVRAPGLPLLLSPVGRILGTSVEALRTTALLFAVAGIAVTWAIARTTVGPVIAAVAAGLLAIAPGWHDSSWQIMPDIPGAVLTLAAVAVILYAARGERLSWWVLAAAPLAGAATLVRYGAPLLIGPAVLAAFWLRLPAVRANRGRAAAALAAIAAAAGVVWFVPAVTGASAPPVLIYAARQDAKEIPGADSAADFFARLLELVGPVFGPLVIVAGGVALVTALRRRTLFAPVVASTLIAASVLVLMLFGIAAYHLRYLTPALPFLAIPTAVGVVQLARARPPRAITAAGIVLAVAGTALAVGTAVARTDEITDTFGPVRTAYHDIAAATDEPCVVLDRNPTAEWYTACAKLGPSLSGTWLADELARADVRPDEPVHLVVRGFENVANPTEEDRAALEQIAVGELATDPAMTVLDLGSARRLGALLAEQRAAASDRPVP